MRQRCPIVLFLLFLNWVVPYISLAQSPWKGKKLVLKYSPQHLFVSCIRFDAEVILQPKHLLVLAPMFYSGKIDKDGPLGDDVVSGVGLEAFHKIYPSKDKNHARPYIAYGLNYHYLSMDFIEKDWVTFTDSDNLQYLKYDYVSYTQYINKTGAAFLFGVDLLAGKHLVFDVHAGVGYEKSFVNGTPSKYDNRYNDQYIGYSYSGFAPRLGLKVGILLF